MHVEKRLVSVVVVPPTFGPIGDATVEDHPENPSEKVISDKQMAEARRAVQTFGARLEEIANGMLIALLLGSGPATDQAAVAARCALRMQWALPECSIVLFAQLCAGMSKTALQPLRIPT